MKGRILNRFRARGQRELVGIFSLRPQKDEANLARDYDTNRLPPQSPNLNAFAERWVRSVKSEVLDQMILFGAKSLRQVVEEYCKHYHEKRNH